MHANGRVAVVVVTHQSATTLKRCVDHALAEGAVAELVIVDNASSDPWEACLRDDARIQVIRNHRNLGFAAACNQGAKASTSTVVLFLNPDCFLPPDALAILLQGLGLPGVALVGARLSNEDGSVQTASVRSTPTPWSALGSLLPRFVARSSAASANRELAPGWHAAQTVSGALMLMRRDEFLALGGFDEGYRLHCEDLDLCRRILLAGRLIARCDEVAVTHLKGTSSRQRPLWIEWQKHRGMQRYFSKFDAPSAPLWLRVLVRLAIWIRFPYAALRAWIKADLSDNRWVGLFIRR